MGVTHGYNSQTQHTSEQELVGVLPTDSTEKVPSRETLSVSGLEITPDLFIIRADVGKAHSPQPTAWSSSGSHNPERLTSLPRPSPMALRSRLISELLSPRAAAPHWGGGGHLPHVPVQTLFLQFSLDEE